jgi:hypothetical protein
LITMIRVVARTVGGGKGYGKDEGRIKSNL